MKDVRCQPDRGGSTISECSRSAEHELKKGIEGLLDIMWLDETSVQKITNKFVRYPIYLPSVYICILQLHMVSHRPLAALAYQSMGPAGFYACPFINGHELFWKKRLQRYSGRVH